MFYGRTSKKLDIKTYFDTSIEHNTRTSIEHPLADGCLQGLAIHRHTTESVQEIGLGEYWVKKWA